jgi:hypothetical protein
MPRKPLKCLRWSLLCGLFTLTVVGTAQAEPNESEGRLAAVFSFGIMSPPFNVGGGLDIGYVWPSRVYLGGQARYHGGGGNLFGGTDEGSSDKPRSLFTMGGTLGYELAWGGIIRPSFDCGVAMPSGEVASPYVGGSISESVLIEPVVIGYSVELHELLGAHSGDEATRGTVGLYLFVGTRLP